MNMILKWVTCPFKYLFCYSWEIQRPKLQTLSRECEKQIYCLCAILPWGNTTLFWANRLRRRELLLIFNTTHKSQPNFLWGFSQEVSACHLNCANFRSVGNLSVGEIAANCEAELRWRTGGRRTGEPEELHYRPMRTGQGNTMFHLNREIDWTIPLNHIHTNATTQPTGIVPRIDIS